MTKSINVYGRNTKKSAQTIAMAAVAAALAGALSLGTAMPALAEEAAPDQEQQPTFAQDDAASDEGAWDATADENGFSADASSTYAPDLGATQDEVDGAEGNGWWWRRVSPTDAFRIAQDYFGVWDVDDWDYQVGRFRGTPAYRVEIDADDWYGPVFYDQGNSAGDADAANCGRHGRGDWRPWSETTHCVAFVNYFTGQVMGAYVDYE